MTLNELKQRVGKAAADYVNANVPKSAIIGIGSGSTVNYFINALAHTRQHYRGAVSTSLATSARLQQHGIKIFDLNEIESLPMYVDGADQIDNNGAMIKGGGGALTCEKIVASVADVFMCIADATKRVAVLSNYPVPIEIVPMARMAISRRVAALGGVSVLRVVKDGIPFITDNGKEILDAQGLEITDPRYLETVINTWPGVVTVGLFAIRRADRCLLSTAYGIETLSYTQEDG